MIIQKVGDKVAITATNPLKPQKISPRAKCSSLDDTLLFHEPENVSKLDINKQVPQATSRMRRNRLILKLKTIKTTNITTTIYITNTNYTDIKVQYFHIFNKGELLLYDAFDTNYEGVMTFGESVIGVESILMQIPLSLGSMNVLK